MGDSIHAAQARIGRRQMLCNSAVWQGCRRLGAMQGARLHFRRVVCHEHLAKLARGPVLRTQVCST